MGYRIKYDKHDEMFEIQRDGVPLMGRMNAEALSNFTQFLVRYLVGRGYTVRNPQVVVSVVSRVVGRVLYWLMAFSRRGKKNKKQ